MNGLKGRALSERDVTVKQPGMTGLIPGILGMSGKKRHNFAETFLYALDACLSLKIP